jgi:hypothetical protein
VTLSSPPPGWENLFAAFQHRSQYAYMCILSELLDRFGFGPDLLVSERDEEDPKMEACRFYCRPDWILSNGTQIHNFKLYERGNFRILRLKLSRWLEECFLGYFFLITLFCLKNHEQ